MICRTKLSDASLPLASNVDDGAMLIDCGNNSRVRLTKKILLLRQ